MELLERVRAVSQATLDHASEGGPPYEWQVSYTLYADEHGMFPILLFWLSLEGHSTWQWLPVENAHDGQITAAVEAMWVRVTSNALLWGADLGDSYETFEDETA